MADQKIPQEQLEGDMIRELQRLIKQRNLHAELIDKRTNIAADPCTHCTSCPCMFIG